MYEQRGAEFCSGQFYLRVSDCATDMQLSQLSRRRFLATLATCAGATALGLPAGYGASNTVLQRQPVILATDIGDDIDDTWALGLLLKSPELDLKLAVGDYG